MPSEYISTVLVRHNIERTRLGIPVLLIDQDLCNGCAEWAIKGLSNNSFYHSKTGSGENIAWRTNDKLLNDSDIANLLFEQWLNERENFTNAFNFPNVKKDKNGGDVFHYSQLIWRDSHLLGVGLARNDKWAYLVCRYAPRGNIVGERVY